MATRLYESGSQEDKKPAGGPSTVVTGTVSNNCDLIRHGKVLVRIPSLDDEVWARLSAPGGGSGAGILYVPRKGDEVLIAMSQDNPEDAFVLGGLWNTQDSPPVDSPVEAPTKRVIQTGLKAGVGHKVEFDDVKQSITIVTTTKQKVTIDPTTIELANTAGTLKITLDNKSQTITIQGVNVEIEAKASLSLKGAKVDVKSTVGPLSIGSATDCSIKGTFVRLN
jgi:uncharacterized protein involved in type VI secretion and phage assembly